MTEETKYSIEHSKYGIAIRPEIKQGQNVLYSGTPLMANFTGDMIASRYSQKGIMIDKNGNPIN